MTTTKRRVLGAHTLREVRPGQVILLGADPRVDLEVALLIPEVEVALDRLVLRVVPMQVDAVPRQRVRARDPTIGAK